MTKLIEYLSRNTTLVALVGAMITGTVLYLLKAAPRALLNLLVRSVTVRLVIYNDDEIFEWVNNWLAHHPYSRKARHLTASLPTGESSDWLVSPGYGSHLIWNGWNSLYLRRTQATGPGRSRTRQLEEFTLIMLGRDQGRIRDLVREASMLRLRRDKLEIRLWDSWWRPVARKAKRPLESVFLPRNMVQEAVQDAEDFFKKEQWHHNLGLPSRLGWLFEGPAGTGKTTLAMLIASHFDKPIYILNLAAVQDDNVLLTAFTSVSPGAIILIEDIDTIAVSKRRDTPPKDAPDLDVPPQKPGITLSGLLNAVDGVAAPDGRLLIMTTNHPEKIDPALTRSNRVDRRFSFGPMTEANLREMSRRICPDLEDKAVALSKTRADLSASDWQSLLCRSRKDPDRLGMLVAEMPRPQ